MREILCGNVFDDLDDLFRPLDKNAKSMRTDIKETENQYEFEIDMPGFKKEEIALDLKDGYLNVSAKKEANEEKSENGGYIKRERHFSASRSYYVGNKIRQDDIKAKYENGVLNVIVPKEQPKEIEKHKIQID